MVSGQVPFFGRFQSARSGSNSQSRPAQPPPMQIQCSHESAQSRIGAVYIHRPIQPRAALRRLVSQISTLQPSSASARSTSCSSAPSSPPPSTCAMLSWLSLTPRMRKHSWIEAAAHPAAVIWYSKRTL